MRLIFCKRVATCNSCTMMMKRIIVVVVSFYLSRFVALLRPISASPASCKTIVLKFLQVGIWHFSFIIMHNNQQVVGTLNLVHHTTYQAQIPSFVSTVHNMNIKIFISRYRYSEKVNKKQNRLVRLKSNQMIYIGSQILILKKVL